MRGLSTGRCPARQRTGRFAGFVCFLGLFFISALSAQQPALVRFAVIGDSGTGGQHQYQVAEQMAAWHERLPYDLVLMLGDNIYGGLFGIGGGNQDDFAKKFDRPYAELLARGVIFRAVLGNHDARHRNGQDLIAAYNRFHIVGPQGYYSFTAGLNAKKQEVAPLVEFFVLNTTRLEKNKQDPEQLAWLEQALSRSREGGGYLLSLSVRFRESPKRRISSRTFSARSLWPLCS